jgi:hypothetical protein
MNSINAPRFLQALVTQNLRIADACALCRVNNKTLAKILRGERPRRLDALTRVINGLKIPASEAFIATTSKTTQGPRLYLVPDRRKYDEIT